MYVTNVVSTRTNACVARNEAKCQSNDKIIQWPIINKVTEWNKPSVVMLRVESIEIRMWVCWPKCQSHFAYIKRWIETKCLHYHESE